MNDREVTELKAQLTKAIGEITSLRSEVEELRREYRQHKHEGEANDGSKRIERTTDLLGSQEFTVGGVAGIAGLSEIITVNGTTTSDRTVLGLATGRDSNPADGVNNSQMILEHQYNTDGSTNQTFFYGIRAPLYIASDGIVKSGDTTLRQSGYRWSTNSLAGAYVVVTSPTGTTFEGYQIASNTERTLTITGGTWGFTGQGLTYTVFIPIYMGSATYPWRRLYTGDGSGGGIRFGYGSTGGGQNGLMYMDSNGMPVWRKPNGSTYTFDLTGD